MEIKSNVAAAQRHASQFSSKGGTLGGLGEVAKDDSTTVAGNAKRMRCWRRLNQPEKQSLNC